MMVLLHCLGHHFLLENPAGSAVLLHPWLQWAIRTIQGAAGKDPLLQASNFCWGNHSGVATRFIDFGEQNGDFHRMFYYLL